MVFVSVHTNDDPADIAESIAELAAQLTSRYRQQMSEAGDEMEDLRAELTFVLTRADESRLARFLKAWEGYIFSEDDKFITVMHEEWDRVHSEDMRDVATRYPG